MTLNLRKKLSGSPWSQLGFHCIFIFFSLYLAVEDFTFLVLNPPLRYIFGHCLQHFHCFSKGGSSLYQGSLHITKTILAMFILSFHVGNTVLITSEWERKPEAFTKVNKIPNNQTSKKCSSQCIGSNNEVGILEHPK